MSSQFYNLSNTLSLINGNAQNFQTLTPLEISSIWPKTCPITLLFPLSLLDSILMTVLPSHLSLKLNSSLRPLLITLPWMILSVFLPLPLPSPQWCPSWPKSSEASYCSQKLCFHACSLPGQTLSTLSIDFHLSISWQIVNKDASKVAHVIAPFFLMNLDYRKFWASSFYLPPMCVHYIKGLLYFNFLVMNEVTLIGAHVRCDVFVKVMLMFMLQCPGWWRIAD